MELGELNARFVICLLYPQLNLLYESLSKANSVSCSYSIFFFQTASERRGREYMTTDTWDLSLFKS